MKLIDNWKTVFRKAYAVKLAMFGIFTPELLQFIADNADLISGISGEAKGHIRFGCLVLIVIFRHVKQDLEDGKPTKRAASQG